MATWRPDLLSLRLFVAVCEEASIARAAEREAMVPSAISKRIAEMEEVTGVSLLIRGARGVRPTPAGTAFLHHARQIVRSTQRLQSEMVEYASGVGGHVRLFANISSIVEVLPGDLSSFLSMHQNVRVDLQERSSQAVVSGVREGAAELGVSLSVPDMADLEVLPYGHDHLALVCHAAHPLATRTEVRFEETLDYDFVALSPDSRTTQQLSGIAARLGRAVNYRVYVSAFDAAAHVIAANLAVGVLALEGMRPHVKSMALKTIPLLDDWARRDILLCMRARDTLSPPARALVEHLLDRCRTRKG
jgi:DNA-binding transcriptional LysR family regulator